MFGGKLSRSQKLVLDVLREPGYIDEGEIRDHLLSKGVNSHDAWLATEGSLVGIQATFIPFPSAYPRMTDKDVKLKSLSYDPKVLVWEVRYPQAYGDRRSPKLISQLPVRVAYSYEGQVAPLTNLALRKYTRFAFGECAPPWEK